MKLSFDRGTLLLTETKDLASLPAVFAGFIWDPRTLSYRAPARYYASVCKSLKEKQIAYEDLILPRFSDLKIGFWNAPVLRPYQETAIELWQSANRHGMIVLPTGAGKTRLALSVMSRMHREESGLQSLCLVPTRALLEQWQSELKKFYSGSIGVQGDGVHTLSAITVATFESAYRYMPELGNRFKLLIIDECHHFGQSLKDEALQMSAAPARLGLTATLPTDERWVRNLSELIGPPVFELTLGDLTGTYLSDFDYYTLHVDLTNDEKFCYTTEISIYKKHFREFKLFCPEGNYLDWIQFASRTEEGRSALKAYQRAKKILTASTEKLSLLSKLLKRHRGQKILVFTADTETAYRISREHLMMPITSEISRKEREEMLTFFKTGKIKALVSCRVLNEGIDVPDAEVAIILGGTQGVREHIQRIGRILRPSPGKKAVIYEIVCRGTLEIRQSVKRSVPLASTITATF